MGRVTLTQREFKTIRSIHGDFSDTNLHFSAVKITIYVILYIDGHKKR